MGRAGRGVGRSGSRQDEQRCLNGTEPTVQARTNGFYPQAVSDSRPSLGASDRVAARTGGVR